MMTVRSQAEATIRHGLEQRTARCAVMGLGFIGTTLMDAIVAAGFDVHGYDRSDAAVDRFCSRTGAPDAREGKSRTTGTDPSALGGAQVVIVAVRALVSPDGSVDLEPLRSAAAVLRADGREDRLVLVESTLPPGTTRVFAEEWVGAGPHSGYFVAHAPERLAAGQDWTDLRTMPHLVGGVDPASTELAGLFLGRLCETVVRVSSPEVSELSKLLENAFISVGVGLTGEITRIAHGLDISASEVCAAAATKSIGYHAFYPGAGIGGHCLPNDLKILRAAAARLGGETPLIQGVIQVASQQPRFVVDRLESLLTRSGAPLSGADVVLVGVGFKIGSPDTTATPASEVVRNLRARGARALYVDSQVPEFTVDGAPVPRVAPDALIDDAFPAGIVLSGDRTIDADRLERAVRVLLDAGGARVLRGAFSAVHRL
jgi:nucleotide sugar dehydrogenase